MGQHAYVWRRWARKLGAWVYRRAPAASGLGELFLSLSASAQRGGGARAVEMYNYASQAASIVAEVGGGS